MDVRYLSPAGDEACRSHSPEFIAPPSDFLEQRSQITYSADSGPVVTMTNIEWRIAPWLRAAAQLKDPIELLKRSAVAFYLAGASSGDVQNSVEGATVLADLSVSGSAAFAIFKGILPKESNLLADVTSRLTVSLGTTPDPNGALASVRSALDRAYQVAWALRDPDPGRRQQTRSLLGWIAVCGEDDPPHRPVNVPSAPFPQFTMPVTQNITVQTRFAVASLSSQPLPAGYPFPGQQSQIAGGPDILRSFPVDVVPSIPTNEDVVLFIHGHSSRLEEFNEIIGPLLSIGDLHGKNYAVIALDLPCNGYSMVDTSNMMFDHTQVAGPSSATQFDTDPLSGSNPTYPLLDYLVEFVISFINSLNAITPIKDRIVAVIGGSLGGNLTLRIAEHTSIPWLKKIIPWSPASVWTTFNHDLAKGLALQSLQGKMEESEPVFPPLRLKYFYSVFDAPTLAIGVDTLPPQPQMWYRDDWPCKADYMTSARLDRREIYNESFRRWHWRVALEQLLFSHWNTDTPSGQPRYASVAVPTLLVAGDRDEYDFSDIYSASIKLAQAMANTPGMGLFLSNNGHSVHDERPVFFAAQIVDFITGQMELAQPMCAGVARNKDGRLEIFGIGTDHALWHNWQQTAGGAWSGWSSLGGGIMSDPNIGSNADGRLEVFVRGTDDAVWHNWQLTAGGAWSGWSSLGGAIIIADPTVVSNADGRLEVFVRGTDDAVWHNWQLTAGGAWSGWNSLGGGVVSILAVGQNHDGRLEIFARGSDNALWHIWQDSAGGGWSGWSSLNGVMTSHPNLALNKDGGLEVFARGSDNFLWRISQVTPGGSWSAWNSLGGPSPLTILPFGPITSDAVVIDNADGRLEVFARGMDNALWHIWQSTPGGSWSRWASLGGVITSDPIVSRNSDGRLEVFARGTDRAVRHIWQVAPGGAWSGWNSLDGVLSELAATA